MPDAAALITAIIIAALAVAVALMAVRFVQFCLADLARTSHLRYLTRDGWTVLIIVTVPLGGMLYLTYGKAP